MLSLLICLTHSLLKWEWMEGFPMSWLEDGWVCSFGCNWLKTGIQLGIIESWKSLKAQVHEIIRRANQVVINRRCKWCAGYGRRGACYPALFKVARLSSHKGAFKHFEADFRVRVGWWLWSYLLIKGALYFNISVYFWLIGPPASLSPPAAGFPGSAGGQRSTSLLHPKGWGAWLVWAWPWG